MADIVLTTLNARYAHCAFGLRYLLANLGELQPRAVLREFEIHQRPTDMAEAILREQPRVVGVGVYIWNVEPATRLVAQLKRLRPELVVVLGGPEVSYETDQQEICRLADYVIAGEADLAFAELCRQVLAGTAPPPRMLRAPLPQLESVASPYDLYSADDLAHRVVYVEASRGCPFACEFCLSSLEIGVRTFPLGEFFVAMQRLLDRGCNRFKFVDRTFNLDAERSCAILEFFLQRYRPGLFLHVELIPDRLPERLRALIRKFPAGALQAEVGIQTFNEEVAARVQRRQDNARAEENLRWLRTETGVHIHADLIVGLPGESLASFAAGFDRLVALQPHEIQVGILKRLRGTPIGRHDAEWGMVYDPGPPYELLANKLLDFATMQRLRRFARYWDLVVNSGAFPQAAPALWAGRSPFAAFMEFSDWLFARAGRTHAIARARLADYLAQYLGRPVEWTAAPAAWSRRQARHQAALGCPHAGQ